MQLQYRLVTSPSLPLQSEVWLIKSCPCCRTISIKNKAHLAAPQHGTAESGISHVQEAMSSFCTFCKMAHNAKPNCAVHIQSLRKVGAHTCMGQRVTAAESGDRLQGLIIHIAKLVHHATHSQPKPHVSVSMQSRSPQGVWGAVLPTPCSPRHTTCPGIPAGACQDPSAGTPYCSSESCDMLHISAAGRCGRPPTCVPQWAMKGQHRSVKPGPAAQSSSRGASEAVAHDPHAGQVPCDDNRVNAVQEC